MEVQYSQKFLEAIQRVANAAQAGQDPGIVFHKEMRELGWRERLNNLYRIQDKNDGKIKFFRPNKAQNKFLDELSGRDLILKPRQLGYTTLAFVYAYDRSYWDGWSTGIMSHLREHTVKLFARVKQINESFKKDWGRFNLAEEESSNTTQISWKESKASITVAYDFRGYTLQFLHVSEIARVEDERIHASFQAVPENGEIWGESTAHGPAGWFYRTWQIYKDKGAQAAFKGHFFPWFMQYPENPHAPKYKNAGTIVLTPQEEIIKKMYELTDAHILWRRWKISESNSQDESMFEQEYPSNDVECFLAGDNQVYPSYILKIQNKFVKDPLWVGDIRVEGKKLNFYEDSKGIVQVWAKPEADSEYCIGADTAEGTGRDSSVAYVFDRVTYEVVAKLSGQLPPIIFAEELWKLGKFYHYCPINPEANNHGHLVISELTRRNYMKLYKRHTTDEITNKPTTKLGFLTTVGNKVTLSEQHVNACRMGKFRCTDKELFLQMSNFVQVGSKNGKTIRREARGEGHDDCVMAAALTYEMHIKLGPVRLGNFDIPDNIMYGETDPDTGFSMPYVQEVNEFGYIYE